MHIVFHRRKKSSLIIEMKLRHCITLQKNTEKTILLYITVKARLQPFTVLFSFSSILVCLIYAQIHSYFYEKMSVFMNK